MKVLSPSQINFPVALLDSTLQTICLSAPHAKAGTTTCTIALANELSQKYAKRVVVIDGCFGETSLTYQAQLQHKKGFFDYIVGGEGQLTDYASNFEGGNLQVIPSGELKKDAGLTSVDKNMAAQAIELLKDKFDCILYDAPFVFSNSNTLTLASLFDGALLVVNNNDTRKEVATSAVNLFAGLDVKVEGVIYNRRRYYVPQWLYRLL